MTRGGGIPACNRSPFFLEKQGHHETGIDCVSPGSTSLPWHHNQMASEARPMMGAEHKRHPRVGCSSATCQGVGPVFARCYSRTEVQQVRQDDQGRNVPSGCCRRVTVRHMLHVVTDLGVLFPCPRVAQRGAQRRASDENRRLRDKGGDCSFLITEITMDRMTVGPVIVPSSCQVAPSLPL